MPHFSVLGWCLSKANFFSNPAVYCGRVCQTLGMVGVLSVYHSWPWGHWPCIPEGLLYRQYHLRHIGESTALKVEIRIKTLSTRPNHLNHPHHKRGLLSTDTKTSLVGPPCPIRLWVNSLTTQSWLNTSSHIPHRPKNCSVSQWHNVDTNMPLLHPSLMSLRDWWWWWFKQATMLRPKGLRHLNLA